MHREIELFNGISGSSNDFRKRWVNMYCLLNTTNRAVSCFHYYKHFVDKNGCVTSKNMAAKNLALISNQELDKAFSVFDRLSHCSVYIIIDGLFIRNTFFL